MNTLPLDRHEWVFLMGLLAYTTGQFLIFVAFRDLETLHAQKPIDFAHWFMLLGVLALMPQSSRFPKFKLNLVGVPLLILGTGLLVGMCVLDFAFWGIDSPELKSEVAGQLINTPSIWGPFMTYSGKIFNLGLAIVAFSYFRASRIGPITVLLGTITIYVGGGWLNVLGYLILTVGFFTCFFIQSRFNSGDHSDSHKQFYPAS